MTYQALTGSNICLTFVLLLSACSSSSDTPVLNPVLEDSADNADSGTVVTTEFDADTDSAAITGSDIDNESETDAGSAASADSDTDNETEADADSSAITDSDTNNESETNADSSANSETDADTVSDTNSGNDESHLIFGSIYFDTYGNSTYVDANFIDLNQPISIELLESELNLQRTKDNCELESSDEILLYGERPDFMLNEALIESISAGEVLTITGPDGTFTELHRKDDDNYVGYSLPEGTAILGTLPNDLSISIPGDRYPGFSDIEVPNPQLLELISTEPNDVFNRDISIKWIPSDNPGSLIYLHSYLDGMYLDCWMVDDGEFTFPDDLKMLIPAEAQGYLNINREISNYVRRDNVVLIVYVNSTAQ